MMAKAAKNRRTKAPSETATGRLELLFEDLSRKVELGFETVLARMDSERAEELAFRVEITRRIDTLEAAVRELAAAVRKNTEDIRKNSEDIRKNSEDIATLRAEVAEMKLELRAAATQAQLQRLEERVTRLEAQVGDP